MRIFHIIQEPNYSDDESEPTKECTECCFNGHHPYVYGAPELTKDNTEKSQFMKKFNSFGLVF